MQDKKTNIHPDIEKKERLEKLQKQMIAGITDYAIVLLDLDGTILSWNKGAEQLKGYQENEILGQNFRIFYMPLDRQEQLPEKLLAQAAKEGTSRQIGRRVRKDGSIFWASVVINALKDENDHTIGFTKLTKLIDA